MAASLLFSGGRIMTLGDSPTTPEAVLIRGERIAFVGSLASARAEMDPHTIPIDLEGGTLVPGFVENHIHMLEVAQDVNSLRLSPTDVQSLADVLNAVEAEAEQRPKGEWIFGWGFLEDYMAEGRLPDRHDLDAAAPDHPVGIRQMGMTWTFNTAGLRKIGVFDDTPDPPGGHMLRDDDEVPLGPMWDNCRTAFVFPSLPIPEEAVLAELFEVAIGRLNAQGITSLNDAGVVSRKQIRAYQRLRRSDRLKARVNMNMYVAYGSEWDESSAPYAVFRSGISIRMGDDWLRVGPAVIGIDGSTNTRRAALLQPYTFGGKGHMRVSQSFLDEFCLEAHRRGFQIGAVAMGDAGNEAALKAI